MYDLIEKWLDEPRSDNVFLLYMEE